MLNWPPGSESVNHDYESEDPNPKEIFTNPQHWLSLISKYVAIAAMTGKTSDPCCILSFPVAAAAGSETWGKTHLGNCRRKNEGMGGYLSTNRGMSG
jgi:hypothetical protein